VSKRSLGESGRGARLRSCATPHGGRGDAPARTGDAPDDERDPGLPGCLLRERRAEELTEATVGRMNARARRGRMRLDVHRSYTASHLELGVRPGGGSGHQELQAGGQEQHRPGLERSPNERLHPDARGVCYWLCASTADQRDYVRLWGVLEAVGEFRGQNYEDET
jgi:hypothetical protein